MEDLALFVGTIAARLRRGSMRALDPLRLVRPGLLGFVSVSLNWVGVTVVGDWIKDFCLVLHLLRLRTRRPAFSLGGEKASAKRDLSGGNASLDARVAR